MNKNNVLAFCFNRDAKEEINKRLMGCEINNQQRYQDYDVASTFHSFALNCLDGCRNILDDNKSANKTTLIKDIIDYFPSEPYSCRFELFVIVCGCNVYDILFRLKN